MEEWHNFEVHTYYSCT